MITKIGRSLIVAKGKIILPVLGLSLFWLSPQFASTPNIVHQTTENVLLKSATAIKIKTPNSSTIWKLPDTAELIWDTKNITTDRSIGFYLIKDDMVVQDLGTFKNNHFANGIELNKSLQTGNNYRVMGIELFPQDKNNIAKFATPFFTIIGMPRKISDEKEITEKPAIRDTFDGRSISYVKELQVESASIRISLWDHGRVDNDIVSIYLNGEAIVSKYDLKYRKKYFDLHLDTSKANDLFLYAHNLGKYPPNTVSIEISDGTSLENIVLNSDLKSCEAVLINVKE